jgi:hypothetical protein
MDSSAPYRSYYSINCLEKGEEIGRRMRLRVAALQGEEYM